MHRYLITTEIERLSGCCPEGGARYERTWELAAESFEEARERAERRVAQVYGDDARVIGVKPRAAANDQ